MLSTRSVFRRFQSPSWVSDVESLRSNLQNDIRKPQRRAVSTTRHARKTIFSGIQPTGVPHLGNYLGALQQWVRLQNEASPDTTLIYSLVDLHAITIRQDPTQLRQWKKESFAMLLAIGLDPKRSIIFHQSDVSAHAELMWILSCGASTGYLGRMTQWKDKTASSSSGSGGNLKLGLFSYPVLQAADVLIHRATHVPVGHDQAQHLEFARQVANGFNETYGGDVLLPPETLISPAKRIMSLAEPKKKMSKSHANLKSRLLLTDSDDAIRGKIKAALTDSDASLSYDPGQRPGVSNLLDILFYSGEMIDFEDQVELAKHLEGHSIKALKEKVALTVINVVAPIRADFDRLLHDEAALEAAAHDGAEKARKSAQVTLESVKKAVGLF
ncbi:hypothetical protein B0A50_07637 [Salinomyces thailandicus]|uniref:tryptophan--tRNA ligase n=1 Tax=Salinomyces thailandicus TaxID=706561 RepID=A0A4U0TL24_9PEZI|nr:hypothetical protein B0A50_07637 [Salinomyces thailandica]